VAVGRATLAPDGLHDILGLHKPRDRELAHVGVRNLLVVLHERVRQPVEVARVDVRLVEVAHEVGQVVTFRAGHGGQPFRTGAHWWLRSIMTGAPLTEDARIVAELTAETLIGQRQFWEFLRKGK
jgi:hypothetical protein